MSYREVRELVCELEPKPDVAPTIRKFPSRPSPTSVASLQLGAHRVESASLNLEPKAQAPARPPVVEPLAPARYKVAFTASAELREKLERLQALMCQAHNTLLAELDYGKDVMARFRASPSPRAIPVDAYGERIAVQARSRAPS